LFFKHGASAGGVGGDYGVAGRREPGAQSTGLRS
jgi:hypothetical protein